MTTQEQTQTPVYLENVLHLFARMDERYKNMFVAKGEQTPTDSGGRGSGINAETLNNILTALQEIVSKMNTGSTLTVAQINALIDAYFDEQLCEEDTTLNDSVTAYFEEKMSTLSGGE